MDIISYFFSLVTSTLAGLLTIYALGVSCLFIFIIRSFLFGVTYGSSTPEVS